MNHKEMRKKYKITLNPLTPIHIGNGEGLIGYNYVIKNNKCYLIDLDKMFEKIDDKDKKIFMGKLVEGIEPLRKFIFNIYDESIGFDYKFDVCKSFINLYNDRIEGWVSKSQNLLEVDNFINQSILGYYIPGSSLKGSIRNSFIYSKCKINGICNYKLKRNGICNYKLKRNGKSIVCDNPNKKFKTEINKIYEKKSLECNNPKDDPFKGIKISDSSYFKDLKVYEVVRVAYKHKANEFEEQVKNYMLMTKSKYTDNKKIDISFNMNMFSGFYKCKNVNININLDDILNTLREKYNDIIDEEIKFYKSNFNGLKEFYEELKEISNTLAENQSLIRIGKGTGFNNTSLNLINKDKNKETQPISRMLCEGKYPLGWAVIQFD